MPNETILLVDDESKILSSLSRSLSEEDFGEIKTAQNASEALDILNATPGVAVVVSDYHMPGMNGIDFLVQVHSLFPDTSRMLLTGVADLQLAVDAVNRGNVFRFLIKPCPSDVFIGAIRDGLRYNQLIVGERELLSKTLNGSIKVMIDILSAQSPATFAQASRLRKLAHELAWAVQVGDQLWEVELAALLCQIGAVTIPTAILKKWQAGVLLKDEEMDMIRSIPRTGRQLIKNIPRLEKIADGVGYQNCTYTRPLTGDSPTGEDIPLIARILKICLDFDRIQENTLGTVGAIKAMMSRQSEYDPSLLELFRNKVLRIDDHFINNANRKGMAEKQIFVDDLRTGMVLTRDVNDKHGTLIVSKGSVVTDVLMYKLTNYFRSQTIIAPIFIESDSHF
jgi:response regulator RpfG family c-di-GMP phosphodiesterase